MKFSDTEIEKKKSYSSTKVIDVNKVDVEKILVSDELAYGKKKETDAKYFIGNKTGKKNRSLFIKLSKMMRYINKVEESQYISLVIKYEKLLKNMNQFGIESATPKKKKLINNQFMTENIWEHMHESIGDFYGSCPCGTI